MIAFQSSLYPSELGILRGQRFDYISQRRHTERGQRVNFISQKSSLANVDGSEKELGILTTQGASIVIIFLKRRTWHTKGTLGQRFDQITQSQWMNFAY